MLCRNKALWLAVESHLTSCNQLDFIIPASHSYATLKFVNDIGCWNTYSRTFIYIFQWSRHYQSNTSDLPKSNYKSGSLVNSLSGIKDSAVVVAHQLLPNTEDPGSNPAFNNFFKELVFCCQLSRKDKKKETRGREWSI